MKHLILILSLFLTVTTAKSDDTDPMVGNYISISNACRFELLAFNLSIQLPGDAGFRVPYWAGEGVLLHINERHVSYFYDASTMHSQTSDFQFSLPGKNREDIELSISYASEKTIRNIEQIKAGSAYISALPSLTSKAGILQGMLLQDGEQQARTYYLKADSLMLVFFIFPEDKQEIRKCEKILKSLQVTDLKDKYDAYLAEQAAPMTPAEAEPNFTYITDTLRQPTVVTIPAFGLQTTYPAGWIYGMMAAPDMLQHRNDTLQAGWSHKDLANTSFLMLDMNGGLQHMSIRLYPKTDDVMTLAKQILNKQKTLNKFVLDIDNIEVEAKTSGTADLQTLSFLIPLKTCIASFSVTGITAENLPQLQPLLSSIRFSDTEKAGLPTAQGNIPPVTRQMKLSEMIITDIPELKAGTLSQNAYESVPVTLSGVGITYDMPRGEQIYAMPVGEDVTGKTHIAIDTKPSAMESVSVSSFMESWSESISTAVLINLAPEISFDNYFRLMVKTYSTYQGVKIKKYGLVTINQKQWALLNYEIQGTPLYMFITSHDGCLLMITYSGKNNQYRATMESMLFSFRFTD